MNLLDFNTRFPDENSCRQYLKTKREQEGVTCNCGGITHYWISTRELWKCKTCGSCQNLRAGTIMEKSHIPVRYWFMTIHLMTSTKKAFSALEIQRQLGMDNYEPVWYMMQKIRKSMGKRDMRYQLQGEIEVDEGFYEVVTLPEKDHLGNLIREEVAQKRGRGSTKQMKVLVMVESFPNPQPSTDKYRKKRVMGFVKMVTIDDLSSTGINYELKKSLDPTSTIVTDGWRGYSRSTDVIAKHIKNIVPPKEAHKTLPWVHTVIANSKRQFLGVHHSIGKDYLQNYLNEFCYKLNRRNFQTDLFDRMIVAGAKDTWY
ncbi:IS1595 family transposase [Mucilaginibacter sp. dw_454]|uniref:IS1595 family transposase n=1 Tax=Mucilaginibacter sp. dw_454 TaxID=2720079 RepID=UPI001BD586F0|nr:IS1595 family transposase [Mucilaginibacter sp. dw_454]